MPSLGWVPAPRYILRRERILKLIPIDAPCRILDVGCGPGALLSELAARGFDAYGVDRSEKARQLGWHLEQVSPNMQLHAELDENWIGTFDVLLSFEVIEHIPDDIGALREWSQYLRPGGRMIISTPAHPSRWNAADEWAGHVRRYSRSQLIHTIEKSGFAVERMECYGFPFGNLMEWLSAPGYRRRLADKIRDFGDANALTDDSGSDRQVLAKLWPIYSNPLAAHVLGLVCALQRPFLGSNLGTGFLAVARRA